MARIGRNEIQHNKKKTMVFAIVTRVFGVFIGGVIELIVRAGFFIAAIVFALRSWKEFKREPKERSVPTVMENAVIAFVCGIIAHYIR